MSISEAKLDKQLHENWEKLSETHKKILLYLDKIKKVHQDLNID